MLGLLVISIAQAVQTPAPPKPQLSFKDSTGKLQAISQSSSSRAAVLFLVLPDCPIARQYASEMERIRKDYAKKKIRTYTVIADPDYTPAKAKVYAKDYNIGSTIILTSQNSLSFTKTDAVSPMAIVITDDSRVIYQGRIDDRFPKLGVQRKPQRRDLRIALDQFLSGKPITVPKTKAVGCIIPPEFLKGPNAR